MKKLLTILCLSVFLVSLASAQMDYDNTKTFHKDIGDYGKYEIRDWFGLQRLVDLELKENTHYCSVDCSAEKEIIMYQKGILISDVRYYTIKGDQEILEPIESYQFSIRKSEGQVSVDDYGYVKTGKYYPNGTEISEYKKIGSHLEDNYSWTPYTLGDEVEIGTYYVRHEGTKDKNKIVDWQIKSNGVWTEEWITWGSQSTYNAHGVTYLTTDSTSTECGSKIMLLEGISSFNVGINIYSPTITTCYLRQSDTTLIATESVSGNIATFTNSLTIGTEYIIGCDAGGSSFNRNVSDVGTYPIQSTTINWTNGYLEGEPSFGNWGRQSTIVNITTFVIGNNITLNSPVDNYTSSLNEVEFNCSTEIIGSGTTLTNISLWHNESGTFEFNQSTDVTGTSNSTTFNSTFDDGSYSWTCQACAVDGTCGFADENRTLTIDTTNPSVSITSPSGTRDYGIVNGSEYLNWTITDDNLDSCWMEYPSTNKIPVSHWRMDEGAGTSIYDLYGDNTGTITDASWNATGGQDGGIGLEFDGEDDFVVTTTKDQIFTTLTLSAWIKPNSLYSEDGDIITRYIAQDGNRSFNLQIYNNNLRMGGSTNGINVVYTSGTTTIPSNSDYVFVSGVWNGTNIMVYVNGILDSTTQTSLASIVNPSGIPIEIGRGRQSQEFNGSIQDVRIYDEALTSTEISNLYNEGALTYLNRTLNCGDNNHTFSLTEDGRTISLYANDTGGNINSSFVNWDYRIFEDSRTLNTSSYETETETFSINLTANSSLSVVTLDYNGTEYSTTKSGNVYSKTLDIPTEVGNNSVRWKFTYAGSSIYSDYSYQEVNETLFTLCNATYPTTFLNISFKDEADLSIINASIPTSTFVYWLGSGAVNKTLTFINNTNNYNYEFCATPNKILNINNYIQYKQGTAYPQRIYNEKGLTYSNTTTDLTLYLLGSADGSYQYFRVLDPSGSVINGVEVVGTRVIEGDDVKVAIGETDSTGLVSFWVNPDFQHHFTFTKTGYDVKELDITPVGTTETVVLGGSISPPVIDDYSIGIKISLNPLGDFLIKNQNYNFNYTISTSYWLLDSWGFTLRYGNGTTIGSQSSTTDVGGMLSLSDVNVSTTQILMEYYYIINSTEKNGTRYWTTYSENDFSLQHLFNNINSSINSNLFGVLGDDEGQFSKALIASVIIILVSGGLVMRYGIASEAIILGMITGILLFLNTLSLLPQPEFLSNGLLSFGDFLVYLTLIMTIGFIIKEERK